MKQSGAPTARPLFIFQSIMHTYYFDMSRAIHEDEMETAGRILREGGLVAFPTETVYGLGANALDEHASARIYEAKGRPSDNPLIVHIADVASMDTIASYGKQSPWKKLAQAFWPGPLTMILPKKAVVPYATTGGLDTVAVRMPSHPVALELIRRGGGFIAAPSANTSGRPSPTKASHVREDLDGRIDAIIDGGDVGIGLESTIVDLTEDVPVILRPGYISQEMLEEVLGSVELDKALHSDDPSVRPKAPGMKYRHYAPKARMVIVEGDPAAVAEKINALAAQDRMEGRSVGILAAEETRDRYREGIVRCAGSRREEITIAMHLYALLREFDALGVDCIYSEAFDTPQMGQAIMNRLIKAAGHQVIAV